MKSECSAVKSAENLPLFGFLNVYKPQGLTSHDVVAKMRRITKVKQIGHTGTLDPFAEGVLPVCIGKSTRLIEYLADDKEYLAFVKFGLKQTLTIWKVRLLQSPNKRFRKLKFLNSFKISEVKFIRCRRFILQ